MPEPMLTVRFREIHTERTVLTSVSYTHLDVYKRQEGMKRFLTGTFKGEYERQLEQEFEDNLTPKTEQ